MPNPSALTAADIARLANVTRATVSQWRRRHPDFPAPSGGTATSPAYDRTEVEEWLRTVGRMPPSTPTDLLWNRIRPHADRSTVPYIARLLRRMDHGDASACPPEQPTPPAAEKLVPAVREAVAERGAADLFDELYDRMIEVVAPRATQTPPELADLMARLADPHGLVLDPCCGRGNLLAAAAGLAGRLRGEVGDPALAALTCVRLSLLHGDAGVRVAPPLDAPPDPDAPLADTVLCHPPFNERALRAERLDPRWQYGRPPRNESELAWLQHCLHRTAPGGTVVILLPPGVAARPSGRHIRSELLRRGALRAVIALPPGAAAPAQLGLQLWILTRPAATDSPHRMLFVDASGHRLGTGRPELAEAVVATWRAFADHGDVPATGTAAAVPVAELFDGSVDLTPSLHITDRRDADAALAIADGLGAHLHGRLDELRENLDALSFRRSDAGARRTLVTVADLERAGDLAILRAEVPRVGDVVIRGVGDHREPTVITERNAKEAGSRYVLRPAAARLDPHFLAGFLRGPVNKALLERGPTPTAALVRRLAVPLLPLPAQAELGRAFRELIAFEDTAERVARLGRDLRRAFEEGLATGVLEPGAES